MIFKLCFLAMATILSMSSQRPCSWTTMIALVRGVIAASILSGSIRKVSGSMSTKIGIASWCRMQVALELQLYAVTST